MKAEFLVAVMLLGAVSVVSAGNCFTQAGVALVKEFEGFRPNFYKDAVGIRTIGYGTACHAFDCSKIKAPISEAQAAAIMVQDLKAKYYGCVSSGVKVPINNNQFSALVSWVYNLGCGVMRTSTLVKKLNNRDFAGAAAEFAKWNKAGGRVLAGLTRRRSAEARLFQTPGPGTCASGESSDAAANAGTDQNPNAQPPDTAGGSPGGGADGAGGSPGGGADGGGGSPGGGDAGAGGGAPGGGDAGAGGGSPGGGSPGGGSPGGGGGSPGGGAPGGGGADGGAPAPTDAAPAPTGTGAAGGATGGAAPADGEGKTGDGKTGDGKTGDGKTGDGKEADGQGQGQEAEGKEDEKKDGGRRRGRRDRKERKERGRGKRGGRRGDRRGRRGGR